MDPAEAAYANLDAQLGTYYRSSEVETAWARLGRAWDAVVEAQGTDGYNDAFATLCLAVFDLRDALEKRLPTGWPEHIARAMRQFGEALDDDAEADHEEVWRVVEAARAS